jgi:hypothetical protein
MLECKKSVQSVASPGSCHVNHLPDFSKTNVSEPVISLSLGKRKNITPVAISSSPSKTNQQRTREASKPKKIQDCS